MPNHNGPTHNGPTHKGHGTNSASHAAAVAQRAAGGQVVEFDDFIDAQLRKTRSHVRSVDIATSVMVLVAGTLAYILLAAVFDHWIVAGGLGFWGRTFFLAVYLVAAATYLGKTLVPLLVRKINPLYAAETIERSQPTLKNALVNFLFFRGHQERLSPSIYRAVEEQAARNLAGSQADGAVDRTKLITIGYVLLGILLACAAYALVSPKDLFRTVGRIAVPWAEIDAPTRTTITEIDPRDAQAFRGQQIEVSARIKDLPDDSVVRLFYTTADGQTVDRPIEMKLGDDGYKHTCLLPAVDGSLQQDLDYRIEAGDAITRPFHLNVVAAPTIFVESVETKYPAYTGLLAQRVERQGDVKAIEGSEITIEALANSDIRSANVDFDCDGSAEMRMNVEGRKAKATFRLALADDGRTAKHKSYQLVFMNEQGQRNPRPVRHQIEVTRDIPPEIEFVAPSKDPFDVPVNGAVTLEVVANDPDFALGLVKVSLAQGDKPLADKLLLSDIRRGQFVGKYRFEPGRLDLKPGDVVTYSALAEDNKSPNPNRTATAQRRIRIAPPGEASGQQDQVAQNDAGDGRSQDRDQGERGQQQKGRRDDDVPPEDKPDASADNEPQEPPDNAADQGERGDGQATQRGNDQQPGDEPQTQGERQTDSQPGNASDTQGQPGEQQQDGSNSPGQKQQGENGSGGEQSDARAGPNKTTLAKKTLANPTQAETNPPAWPVTARTMATPSSASSNTAINSSRKTESSPATHRSRAKTTSHHPATSRTRATEPSRAKGHSPRSAAIKSKTRPESSATRGPGNRLTTSSRATNSLPMESNPAANRRRIARKELKTAPANSRASALGIRRQEQRWCEGRHVFFDRAHNNNNAGRATNLVVNSPQIRPTLAMMARAIRNQSRVNPATSRARSKANRANRNRSNPASTRKAAHRRTRCRRTNSRAANQARIASLSPTIKRASPIRPKRGRARGSRKTAKAPRQERSDGQQERAIARRPAIGRQRGRRRTAKGRIGRGAKEPGQQRFAQSAAGHQAARQESAAIAQRRTTQRPQRRTVAQPATERQRQRGAGRRRSLRRRQARRRTEGQQARHGRSGSEHGRRRGRRRLGATRRRRNFESRRRR